MVRWRPWPPLLSTKFRVRLVVRRIEGLRGDSAAGRVVAEVRWKGPTAALGSLRRTVRKNRTREEAVGEAGVAEWDEEFEAVCTLTAHRENAFHPWEVAVAVLNGLNQVPKDKECILGTALLNLAKFASAAENEIEITLPLLLPGVTAGYHPSIHLAVSLLELRASQESSATVQRPMLPDLEPPSSGDAVSSDDLSALKAGLRRVKILKDLMSTRKSKKTSPDVDGSEERCSARSEDAEIAYPFDSDSHDEDLDEGYLEDCKENIKVRKSFSYGTVASANYVGGSFYSDIRIGGEYDDWIYYGHRSSDAGCSRVEETTTSVAEQCVPHTSKRSILPWRKRKIRFRYPKPKGEPLLKKAYAEEGGDDIDYDRRMLSSPDEFLFAVGYQGDYDNTVDQPPVSDFGDDHFVIGSWEFKEIISRDGRMKLSTQVFFASIDQRSEQAAGESACTALVTVIADWFQKNQDLMPIKSQFECLIREGSLEWRNLCESQTYREHFPDKHFDLETVLQANIRPLSVVPRKSFIGFFHPEETDGNSDLDFLHGAMSFDSIWDEISLAGSDCTSNGSTQIYIVSWNDHFFILKVENDAYYIIDTLGERLYEGCDQAYILKFDKGTTIHKIATESKTADSETNGSGNAVAESSVVEKDQGKEDLVREGKESCMEYIKSFLAAIPIRELHHDIKKGRMSSTPLLRRLQIEFHFTETLKDANFDALSPATEAFPEFSWQAETAVPFDTSTAVVVV